MPKLKEIRIISEQPGIMMALPSVFAYEQVAAIWKTGDRNNIICCWILKVDF